MMRERLPRFKVVRNNEEEGHGGQRRQKTQWKKKRAYDRLPDKNVQMKKLKGIKNYISGTQTDMTNKGRSNTPGGKFLIIKEDRIYLEENFW